MFELLAISCELKQVSELRERVGVYISTGLHHPETTYIYYPALTSRGQQVYPNERTYTMEFECNIDAKNQLFMCSDTSESHSFIFDMKRYHVHEEKHFELVSDFEFNDCEKNLTSSFQELLSVILKTTFWLYQLRTA